MTLPLPGRSDLKEPVLILGLDVKTDVLHMRYPALEEFLDFLAKMNIRVKIVFDNNAYASILIADTLAHESPLS
jgi:hypothetical protein